MIDRKFWEGKKVYITGNTGFKGSWLSLWLNRMGAKVFGYSKDIPTEPSLFKLLNLENIVEQTYGDIRDYPVIKDDITSVDPEVVFHMAAQPLVKESYENPIYTFETNVIGTVNLLESIRSCNSVRSVVNVTTDKCYENKEWPWGYRENEPMGGFDPYSNSKGCSELVTSSYRNSFFNIDEWNKTHNVGIATARAGNVIGGGDWAKDRLVPDCYKAIFDNREICIRNPYSIRPWQHVLEPLNGYLLLAEKIYQHADIYSGAWNFGPFDSNTVNVETVVSEIISRLGKGSYKIIEDRKHHEANLLKLDISKAQSILKWSPILDFKETINFVNDWYMRYSNGCDMKSLMNNQIDSFIKKSE